MAIYHMSTYCSIYADTTAFHRSAIPTVLYQLTQMPKWMYYVLCPAWLRFALQVDHADSAPELCLPRLRLFPSISHVAPDEEPFPDDLKLVG